MTLLTRRRLFATAFTLFGAAAVSASLTADATLVIGDTDSGNPLLEVPVDQGDEVTIAYTHSVQRTPVEDVYVIDGSRLRADRSVFHSFGAGLPTEGVERTDEGYVVRGTKSHDELLVVPGEIAGHELVVNGERYDLVEIADGSVVLFVADRTVSGAVGQRGHELITATDERRSESRLRMNADPRAAFE